jgi:hypothetical protein
MWFVLFLFVFSLVGLPVFLWLRNRASGRRLVAGFARATRVPGLLVLIPVFILVLPWLQTDDDLSGQPPVGFFLLVLLGFLLLAEERIGRVIDRDWVWLLAVGLVASVAYIWAEPRAWGDTAAVYIGKKLLYEIGVWCVILGLLGLGHRFLMGGGRVLKYATEAAYPFYILHQTAIVAFAYVVCAWDWPVWAKFTVIALASLTLSLGVYEVAVRRWGPVRFLFGMKPRRVRQHPAPAETTAGSPAP